MPSMSGRTNCWTHFLQCCIGPLPNFWSAASSAGRLFCFEASGCGTHWGPSLVAPWLSLLSPDWIQAGLQVWSLPSALALGLDSCHAMCGSEKLEEHHHWPGISILFEGPESRELKTKRQPQRGVWILSKFSWGKFFFISVPEKWKFPTIPN